MVPILVFDSWEHVTKCMLSLITETLSCQNYWSVRRNWHQNRRWDGGRRRKVKSARGRAWRSWRLSGGCPGAVRTDSVWFLSTQSAVSVPWRGAGPPGDPLEKCPHPHHVLPPSPHSPFFWANCPEVLNEECVDFMSSLSFFLLFFWYKFIYFNWRLITILY